MKTQQYLSILAVAGLYITMGCSTHPEIKPYQVAPPQELAVEAPDLRDESVELPDVADGFVEDAELTEDVALKSETEETEKVSEVAESKPAPVEKKAETPKAVASSQQKTMQRRPASQLENGFFVFANNCEMKSAPKANSKNMGSVSKGKKLWLDVHNSSWLKAYKKSGTVYVSSDCIQ